MKFLFKLFVFERKARLYFSSSDFEKNRNQIEEERDRKRQREREREQMDNRPAEGERVRRKDLMDKK